MSRYRRPRYNSKNRTAVGILIVLIGLFLLLALCNALGVAGVWIKAFLVGTFGLAAYGYVISAMLIGLAVTFGIRVKLSAVKLLKYVGLLVLGIFALHIYSSSGLLTGNNYGGYLSDCYQSGGTAGGLLAGLGAFPLMRALTTAVALIIVCLAFFAVALLAIYPVLAKRVPYKAKKTKLGKRARKEQERERNSRRQLADSEEETPDNRIFRGSIDDESDYELERAPRTQRRSGFDVAYPNATGDEDIPPYDSSVRARNLLFGENKTQFGTPAGEDVPSDYTTGYVQRRSIDEFRRGFSDRGRTDRTIGGDSTYDRPRSTLEFSDERDGLRLGFGDLDTGSRTIDDRSTRGLGFEDVDRPRDLRANDGLDDKRSVRPERADLGFDGSLDSRLSQLRAERTRREQEAIRAEEEKRLAEARRIEEEKRLALQLKEEEEQRLKEEALAQQAKLTEEQRRKEEQLRREAERNAEQRDDSFERRAADFRKLHFSEDAVATPENETKSEALDWTKTFKTEKPLEKKSAPKDAEKPTEQKQSEPPKKAEVGKSVGGRDGGLYGEVKKQSDKSKASKEIAGQISIEETFRENKVAMPYAPPPLELLTYRPPVNEDAEESYRRNSQTIEDTLAHFGFHATVESVVKGPTFSRYVLRVPDGTNISKIHAYEQTLSMKLGGKSIEILAPIPNRDAIGIDVPNDVRTYIGMHEMMCSPQYTHACTKSKLAFALGKDLNNDIYTCDLEKMPHLLVAGATSSGKSVCLNGLIINMLFNASPDEVRFILIDPKRVELAVYGGIPHLLTEKVICEVEAAYNALNWLAGEMERRFGLFVDMFNSKNLREYNSGAQRKGEDKLPYIVVIIDELANLIAARKKDFENVIVLLASKARAAGIHLVLSTQRPSVDVITGTIKANLPARVTFSLTSSADARTIMQTGSPEKLIGNGDMLYQPPELNTPMRLQCAMIENKEVYDIVNYIKQNNQAYFDPEIERKIFRKPASSTPSVSDASGEQPSYESPLKKRSFDALIFEAMEYFLRTNKATVSSLLSKFQIGFGRANSTVMSLELLGWVSELDQNTKQRSILVSGDRVAEVKAMFMRGELAELDIDNLPEDFK